MNALSDMPREFGQAARRLRPDLVYAMVLANPTMADTGAVFNSTALTTAGGHANYAADASHGNLGGPLAAASLQLAIVEDAASSTAAPAATRCRSTSSPVPARPAGAPVHRGDPAHLRRADHQHSDGGTFNPLKGKLKPVVEARLGTVGVTDPDSGTAYTGTAVNYWLAPARACTPASPTAAARTAAR
jgi:hypothetical protein